MTNRSGLGAGRFNNINAPGPERGIRKKEAISENNFWSEVEARKNGFMIYECLEPFVNKEIDIYLDKNPKEKIDFIDLKKIGKDFFEEITQKIKDKIKEYGKNTENIDAETVTALFWVLVEKRAKKDLNRKEILKKARENSGSSRVVNIKGRKKD